MMTVVAPDEAASNQKAPRKILTFYSYKGGTGRSMALANVAWMLALNNRRVLVIDWDLEAPGLHRYFHPFLTDKELQSTRGLIDFVEDLAARSAVSSTPLPDSEGDISSCVISLGRSGWNWEDYGERAGIDLLGAGQQSAGYSKKVNSFNWISFYQSLGGRRFLEYMAAQLREIYDFILIDSRTGVSDTSGICTVEMPDAVVACFTLNEQSIRGAANICDSIVSQRKELDDERKAKLLPGQLPPAPFRIYPIPTRIEQSEYTKKQVALALVQNTFSRYLGDLGAAELRRYWGSLQMLYVPIYAFEEIPAVFGDSPYDQSSLGAFVGRLTRTLTGDNSFSLQFLADDLRLEVFGWYQRQGDILQDSAKLAEAAFEQFGEALQLGAIQVLLRLVQFAPNGVSPQVLNRNELQRGLSEAVDGLVKARVLKAVATSNGQALQLSDPTVLQTWPAYIKWIQDDTPFLQWRQSINTSARSWRLANQRESDLLRGQSLKETRAYLNSQADKLNDDEREYISASIEYDERQQTMEELQRTTQASLKDQLEQLRNELSTIKEGARAPKWYLSWRVVLPSVAALALSAFTVAFEWQRLLENRFEVENERQSSETKLLNDKLTQMQRENRDLETRLAATVSTSKRVQVSPTVSTPAPPIVTCIIQASPRDAWPQLSDVYINLDKKPVGSWTVPIDFSGVDVSTKFNCQIGKHSYEITNSKSPLECTGEVSVMRSSSVFRMYFERHDGKLTKCALIAADS